MHSQTTNNQAPVDWSAVARAYVGREPRPAAFLAPGLQVRCANDAMLRLTQSSAHEIVGADWLALTGLADQSDDAAVRTAIGDGIAKVVQNHRIPFFDRFGQAAMLVCDLMPLGAADEVGILLTVLDVQAAATTPLAAPASGLHYEIEGGVSQFGRILRVWSANDNHRSVKPGEHCYRAFFGRDQPCTGCPAVQTTPLAGETRTAVIGRSQQPMRLDIVSARANAPASYLLTVQPVGERELSDLHVAKLDLLTKRHQLSQRERSVLDLLLLGRSAEDIAAALEITSRTVKYHQRNIQEKLGAESRLDLFRLLL